MRLPPAYALVAGIILAILEALQLDVSLDAHLHRDITIAVVVIAGFGVMAVAPGWFTAHLPHPVVLGLTAAAGIIGVQQTSWQMPDWSHELLGAVIVVITALLSPTAPPTVSPPA